DMDADVSEQALTPVYPLTEGIHQKAIRRLAAQALSMADESRLPDLLPEPLIPAGYRLPLRDALRLLHQPPAGCNETSPKLTAARSRLAFEELLSHHLSLGRFRTQMQAHRAPVLAINRQAAERFVRSLPFALTGAQQRVI